MTAEVAHPEILKAGAWFLCIMFTALGGLSMAASIKGWQWFFDTVSAQSLTGRAGNKAARLFYGILGVAITAMGIFITVFLCRL